MRRFDKSYKKEIVELVSAGAVLPGLIFVGLELKQNTEAVQAATLQGITDATQAYLLLMAENPDLNGIWRAANEDPHALGESDASRYFFILRAQWLRYQNAYLQWQRGTMSDTDWTLYANFICNPAGSTTAKTKRELWSDHRAALLDEFVAYVESFWMTGTMGTTEFY